MLQMKKIMALPTFLCYCRYWLSHAFSENQHFVEDSIDSVFGGFEDYICLARASVEYVNRSNAVFMFRYTIMFILNY
jgi:hypothetical protein